MRLSELLRRGSAQLAAGGVTGAGRDARWILAHAADIPRERLSLHLEETAADGVSDRFDAGIAARGAGRPVSRIVGRREFFGRTFDVTDDVLDPRPETETVVNLALNAPFGTVLDLGTGSGCILVTLLAERAMALGVGTDLSPAALGVARGNAERAGVAGRARFRTADWFDGIEGRFDLIVSNPPYIAAAEIPHLAAEVRDHDPAMALSPGTDGLSAYSAIADRAARHLSDGGRLIVEIGWRQGPQVAEMFDRVGLDAVAIHTDLEGRDRAVTAALA